MTQALYKLLISCIAFVFAEVQTHVYLHLDAYGKHVELYSELFPGSVALLCDSE